MKDRFDRTINYLRISVTDRCNFRCQYCIPHEEGIQKLSSDQILSFESIEKIARSATPLGIDRIRLTGGEPLERKNLTNLIYRLARIDEINDLSMTTNGSHLPEQASSLKKAGLDRINISLDSLDPSTFSKLTRHGNLKTVLNGIESAKSAGLDPVKINTVLIEGVNDSEVTDLVKYAAQTGLILRFIAVMPIGAVDTTRFQSPPLQQVKETLVNRWDQIETNHHKSGAGPANYLHLKTKWDQVQIGFIFPQQQPFCSSCNKLRLTPQGTLKPCLARGGHIELNDPETAPQERITASFKQAIRSKPREHKWLQGERASCEMSQIGG